MNKALTPAEINFQKHMTTYAEAKGFANNSQSAVWQNALVNFSIYSEAYKAAMPYDQFVKHVIKA